MMLERKSFWLPIVAIAFLAGYFLSDDSAEVRRLQLKLSEIARDRGAGPSKGKKSLWEGVRSGSSDASTSTSSQGDDELSRILTQEDLAATHSLNDRRREGEYLLKFETPVARKSMELDIRNSAAKMAAKNSSEYDQIFSQMGLSAEQSEKLKTHAAKIHKASLETSMAMFQLLAARNEYDKRVRAQMSEADYLRYREFEESKHARQEFSLLQNYLQKGNIGFDPNHQETVMALIQEARAYSDKSWFGPFDELPQIAVGAEMVASRGERDIVRLKERADELLRRGSERGVSEEILKTLQTYYSEKLREKQSGVNSLRTPGDPLKAFREQVLQSQPNQGGSGR